MRCYLCGSVLGDDIVCPGCGIQIKVYKEIITISDHLYNEGLRLANIRDLEGSVNFLKLSLKYNKVNIPARNLLGLVYYELGDIANALSEWVISRNYMPEDNICNEYLDMVHSDKNFIAGADKMVKKYNLAVGYCAQGDYDLARIQLKKLVAGNFRSIAAYKLLTLLYLKSKDYKAALNTAKKALKIDASNTQIKAYIAQARLHIPAGSRTKKSDEEYIKYKSGNEMIITPRTTYKDTTPFSTMINIVLGVVIGVLVTGFLIVPNVKQNAKSDAYSVVTEANDELDTRDAAIESLNSDIDELNLTIENLQDEASEDEKTISSYEELLTAYIAYKDDDLDAAGEALSNVKRKLLDADSRTVYDTISEDVQTLVMEDLYDTGIDANSEGDYETAIEALSEVVESDEEYEDGNALFYLAQALFADEQYDEAYTYYERVIELFPGTQKARTAASQLDEIDGIDDSDET